MSLDSILEDMEFVFSLAGILPWPCARCAAKYEEAECNMPMISELADATEMALTTPIVTRGELELVQK